MIQNLVKHFGPFLKINSSRASIGTHIPFFQSFEHLSSDNLPNGDILRPKATACLRASLTTTSSWYHRIESFLNSNKGKQGASIFSAPLRLKAAPSRATKPARKCFYIASAICCLSPWAAFGGFLPILYGGDNRQRSNPRVLPFRMRL